MFQKFKNCTDVGLLVLRIGVGASFVINHGWKKMSGGPEFWEKLGGTMQNFGITFLPAFWGFMASFAEFFCAIFLILGFFTKRSSILLAITMFVAAVHHLSKGESANYPIELFFVFLALAIIGGGKYSIDEKFLKK